MGIRKGQKEIGGSDIPHPGMTPLSPSELLPLREADGPGKEQHRDHPEVANQMQH